ncbi:MAG TPA: hypothetical protein VMV57_13015 [Terracidiphilus sp.]|nr:hypothetical protein [Terracidiphilus sp.]
MTTPAAAAPPPDSPSGLPPAWRRFARPAVVLFAALLAASPLLFRGASSGHDFDFHFVSWLDALHSWSLGIPYPHWAPSSNFGAGEPLFVFYPPLSWMLGAALGAMLPWTLVPFAVTFLLLAGTGFGTRALARQAMAEGPAVLAGCFAIFSGYALFDAFERTDYGELAGGLWIPLILLFLLRDRRPNARLARRALDGSAVPLALVFAGAWLSNDPLGVMASYLLAATALAAALLRRSWAPILRAGVSTALGLSLVAIYLVPAAYEQRWVDVRAAISDPGEQIRNSWLFVFHGDPALSIHDSVLRTASRICVGMVLLALLGFFVSWRRGTLPGRRRWWIPLALIPPAVLLLQLPVSQSLWDHLPKLEFLQFPWRWLVVLEAPMAVFVAAAVWPAGIRRRWLRAAAVASIACLFLIGAFLAEHTYFSVGDVTDKVPSMVSAYQQGIGFTGDQEYAPRDTDPNALAGQLPDACFNTDPYIVLGKYSPSDGMPEWDASQGSCQATFSGTRPKGGPSPEHLRIVASIPRSGFLILGLRRFPAWRIRVNGRLPAQLPQRKDGLIAVPVPAGRVELTADWSTTPDALLGRWLTALSLLLLTALGLWEQERLPPRLS